MPTNLYWLRPKIRSALWLWHLLNGVIKYDADEQWLLVAEGRPIGDMEIGARLFCTEETVKLWRDRLESVGLIRATVLPEKDAFGLEARKYEVLNLAFGAKQGPTPAPPLGSQTIN